MKETKLVRLPYVIDKVGAARSTIWWWIKKGEFPSPIKLSPRVTVWKLSDIEEWIESKQQDHQVQGEA